MPENRGIAQAVGNALRIAAPAIDDTIAATLQTVGVGIGEADVTINGVRCGKGALVG